MSETRTVAIPTIKEELMKYAYNPASIQRIAVETLKAVHNGEIESVSGSSPFAFALEATAVNTSAFIDEAVALNRKQYPVAAQTEEDLYLHMSDKDYIDRFAVPSKATFRIALDKDEVLSKLVFDDDLGISKLVIPRNTEFAVNGMVFTLQYPIEIRQLRHGGLQVIYNTNITSPIQKLDSNIIKFQTIWVKSLEYLVFDVELLQVEIKTLLHETDLIATPSEDIILTDEYYYLRAYIWNNGRWVEFKTTHSDLVYNIAELTAVLRVFEDYVNVSIPQIYMNAGMLTGQLRFDLYQTRGELHADLGVYALGSIVATFKPDTFEIESSKYSAPLKTIKTFTVLSQDITTGGATPMTFEELRRRVINNSAGAQVLPITPHQAEDKLVRNGFEVVKNIDNIVNRTFLATRRLPAPSNPKLVTPASASIETIVVDEKTLRGMKSVNSNFRSVTITPNTLFENKSGVMKLVPDAKVTALKSLSAELLASQVTNGNYFYTPFHYVLDFNKETFDCRPYFLDRPEFLYRSFISDNDKTLMQVSVEDVEISRTETGYKLVISVESSDNFKQLADNQVFVQLAFKPEGEKDYAYCNGVLEGLNSKEERIFSFDLSSNFYVSDKNLIQLTEFKMFTNDKRLTNCKLEQEFDILFATSAPMNNNWTKDEVDDKLGTYLLPDQIYGIANEMVCVRFGRSLDNLWSRSRSIISTGDYLTYNADVPLLYEEDVHDIDPTTGSSVQIVNGKVEYRIKHRKGDPVLDANNKPMYKHRKGDVVLDANGKPSFADDYGLNRQLDVMMIEGAYWFATDAATVAYRDEINRTFIDWIVDGLGSINKNLLEQTKIYFYPKSTVGQIDVMINNSARTFIDSAQRFVLKLYVSDTVYSDNALRAELNTAAIRVLSEELKKDIITNSNILDALKETFGEDVIGIDISGLGGNERTEVITVLNDAKRLSLKKRLVAQGDGSLIVEEDVTCDYVRHDTKELD